MSSASRKQYVVILASTCIVLVAAGLLGWILSPGMGAPRAKASVANSKKAPWSALQPVAGKRVNPEEAAGTAPALSSSTAEFLPASGTRIPEIDALQSAALAHRYDLWLAAHGCFPSAQGGQVSTPEERLRVDWLNGNLMSASTLGVKLLWDGSRDRRAEAKKVLWEAMVQGSTCAMTIYGIYGYQATHWTRHVVTLNGRRVADYRRTIPITENAQSNAIVQGFAWDMVIAMRTGVSSALIGGQWQRVYPKYGKLTKTDWSSACQQANELYQTLQSDREAQGLGSFDNAPAPMELDMFDSDPSRVLDNPKFIQDQQSDPSAAEAMYAQAVADSAQDQSPLDYSSRCPAWPTPAVRWHLAIVHYIKHDGIVEPSLVWVPDAEKP